MKIPKGTVVLLFENCMKIFIDVQPLEIGLTSRKDL